jgi:glycosyltransferase involved in cell wall biosynthesis
VNDRLLEASLGVVGLTRFVAEHAARRLPGRPVLHLPHHLCLPGGREPSREEARRLLGLPEDALVVTAPGLATPAKGLLDALRALTPLRDAHPGLRFVVAGACAPELPLEEAARAAGWGDAFRLTGRLTLADFVLHLAAADLILALRFPSHGEISGALVRALGLGRPALVTAGTPASQEFPEGVVVPVDPGPGQEDELRALLGRLLDDAPLRARISALARAHVRQGHDLERTVDLLAGFLEGVAARKAALLATLAADRAEEGSLLGYLLEEVRGGARDLGLPGVPLGLEPLLRSLAGRAP